MAYYFESGVKERNRDVCREDIRVFETNTRHVGKEMSAVAHGSAYGIERVGVYEWGITKVWFWKSCFLM